MNLEGLEAARSGAQHTKEQEALQEQGGLVTLRCLLPSGEEVVHRFPAGATVAYVKLVIEQNHGLPVSKQVLTLAGKPLLDPFSLCDYPAMQQGKTADVDVRLSD